MKATPEYLITETCEKQFEMPKADLAFGIELPQVDLTIFTAEKA